MFTKRRIISFVLMVIGWAILHYFSTNKVGAIIGGFLLLIGNELSNV